MACREASQYVTKHLAVATSQLQDDALLALASTTMASKVLGADGAFFSKMCVDAVKRVAPSEDKLKEGEKVAVDRINVLKSVGGGATESMLVNGYALNCTRASQAMPLVVNGAKIACLDFSLRKDKLNMGYQVVVKNTEELEKIRQREADIVAEKIKLILSSGCNVVLTTKGIDDMCMKYFVEAGCMAVRRVTKDDIKRIAKATGATVVLSLADVSSTTGAEEFNPAYLGRADVVAQERIADEELIFIRGTPNNNTCSLVFRGPNSAMLDEMERAMHDSLCAVARALESGHVVAGGGAVETALNIYLENFATSMGSRQQLAVAEFASALLVIPRVLALNGAFDAVDLVAKLRAHHNKAQSDEKSRELAHSGLDLVNGTIRNNIKAGVLEPLQNKIRCLQFATEAAITILRIDDVFKLNQKEVKNKDPHGHGH